MASAIFGNCVVLPEPVSPQTMMTWWSRRAASISWRLPLTGRLSGKVMAGNTGNKGDDNRQKCRIIRRCASTSQVFTMQFDDYVRHDATGLAQLVRQGEVHPSELLETAIEITDCP